MELSLPVDKFRVIKAKRFSAHKQPELAEILKDHERTFLLFPGKSSQPLETIDTRQPYNIVIIDGTWAEARCIYHNSHDLKNMKKVVLNVQKRSNYVRIFSFLFFVSLLFFLKFPIIICILSLSLGYSDSTHRRVSFHCRNGRYYSGSFGKQSINLRYINEAFTSLMYIPIRAWSCSSLF